MFQRWKLVLWKKNEQRFQRTRTRTGTETEDKVKVKVKVKDNGTGTDTDTDNDNDTKDKEQQGEHLPKIVNQISPFVFGLMSPYPMVVIVVTDQ